MNGNKIIVGIISTLSFVIILGIAYAAFTGQLNITGTDLVRNSKWKVYISRISESATTTGTATVILPTIANGTNATEYASSDVKYAVDAWANDRFQNNELKVVNGYKARLITKDELTNTLGCSSNNCNNSSYTWLFNNKYWYWTMNQYNNYTTYVWGVTNGGYLGSDDVRSAYGVVRPVINIYKSALKGTQ